jgi:quercetin dioxygenase-like cupin family protein
LPRNNRKIIGPKSVLPDKSLSLDRGFQKMALRWLIDENTVGSESGVLGYTVFSPGASHKPHVHEHAEEYIITTKGRGATLVSDKWYEMKPGDIFFIPKNTVHSTKNTMKKGTLEMYFVSAGAPRLEKSGYTLVDV